MAVSYAPSTGLPVKGCTAESGSGIKIASVTTTIRDPKLMSFDEDGTPDGFAYNYAASVSITITGEVSDTTGTIPLMKFGQDNALSNEVLGKYADAAATFHGIAATDFTLDGDITYGSSRDGWRSFAGTWTAWPSISLP